MRQKHAYYIYTAFLHFYHMDIANAMIHYAAPKFSPITFRLAELLSDEGAMESDWHEVDEVLGDKGAYEEDKGR